MDSDNDDDGRAYYDVSENIDDDVGNVLMMIATTNMILKMIMTIETILFMAMAMAEIITTMEIMAV